MLALGKKLSIRRQLLGLFGIVLLGAVLVQALDERERRLNAGALEQLRDDSLVSMRRIKAVSDAYGLDYVDTTFRVRNYLMSWEEGLQVLAAAEQRVDAHWRTLRQSSPGKEQRELIAQIPKVRFDRGHLKGFGDASIDYEFVYYVLDPGFALHRDVQQHITLAILALIEREGVRLITPTQVLHAPALA